MKYSKTVHPRWGLIILIFLIFGLTYSTRADSNLWTEKKPFPVMNDGSQESSQTENTNYIYLAVDAFDPLQSIPNIPSDLAYSFKEAGSAGVYILQFNGPVQPFWKTNLQEIGVIIGDYIPDYAFLVYLQPGIIDQIKALPFVRWIGPYHPAYKLPPQFDLTGERSYRIKLAPWADRDNLEQSLTSISKNSSITTLEASVILDGEALLKVARLPEVIWIEPYQLNYLHNDIAGGTILGGSVAWSNGFTGAGNTVAVTDSGLDTGNPANIHPDFSGRVAHISSWPVQDIDYGDNCFPNNVGADDGAVDVDSGHGSHVTGSLTGSGAASSGQFRGLAYEATITFQAVEQWTDWPESCPLSDGYYVTGIPSDLRLLLNQVYNWGARIQNYSWGGGLDSGQYDSQAVQVDDFIFNHQEMTISVSAGNDGEDLNQDGYVDIDSIKSPGVAKNLITIGASDNERSHGGYSQLTWTTFGFNVDPTSSDEISDNRYELAAFSSRGPTNDGRIKPELVAPGTDIVSVRSSQADGTGWGIYNANANYMYNGGTSMASPLAAGAAVLVRDYYRTSEAHMNPSAALIKATLINTAVDMDGYGNDSFEAGQPIPNPHEGWGLIDVAAATTPGNRQFVDETTGLNTGGLDTHYFNLYPTKPLKVTLTWSDYPGSPPAGKALVNDLNLRLTAPDGTSVYWGNQFLGGWSRTGGLPDSVNNVENVYIQVPLTGIWKVEIIGQNVPQGPQPYALVVDGEIVTKAPLALTSITPAHAFNNAPLTDVIILGAGFEPATIVQLKQGSKTLLGSNLTVDVINNRITADFNLNAASVGWWDVIANSPYETAVLKDGFYVKDASLPDLEIDKTSFKDKINPGNLLTYTIHIANTGYVTATGATFTDTLPAGTLFVSLDPECEDGVVALSNGFACSVQPMTLTAGASIDYTLVVSVPESTNGLLTNQVELKSLGSEAYLLNNQSEVNVLSGILFYYLPQAMKNHRLIPSAPLLFPIENSDNDGSYTITWQAGPGPLPTDYDLKENDIIILSGFKGTMYNITGKSPGSFQYVVRANNASGSGPWSNSQNVTVGSVTNKIENGDFEKGQDGSWIEESSNDFDLILQDFSPISITPHSGAWAVWLGGWEDEQSAISQNVSVPIGQSLGFWFWSASEETNCENDVAYVLINQTIIDEIKLCETFETNQWSKRLLDIGVFAGDAVNLKFYVQTNGSLNSNLFLDDIGFE